MICQNVKKELQSMLHLLSVITNMLQYSTTSLSFLGVSQVSCFASCFSQIVLKALHLHKTHIKPGTTCQPTSDMTGKPGPDGRPITSLIWCRRRKQVTGVANCIKGDLALSTSSVHYIKSNYIRGNLATQLNLAVKLFPF
jgi:hypothetical protein